MKEITGNLITLSKPPPQMFDVIAHGCNCFCVQKAGIAAGMAKEFKTDIFPLEMSKPGDFNKLGNIEAGKVGDLFVINAYTQFRPGANLDYSALALCLKKINHRFKGMKLGLPQIGCGIAGGDWGLVKGLIEKYVTDLDVTIVIYDNL